MIDRTHTLSVVKQCRILRLARSTAYYTPQPTSDSDLQVMRRIDELHLEYPFAGSRMLRDMLRQEDLKIDQPNQVWATDITYIPMRRGFVYLIAVLDWHSRRVLSWRLSNTMTTDFCLDAVQEAIARYGVPDIFNTDQGSQFTSSEFTGLLKSHGIQISMDGKGCWRDNVFVERLWKSVKYEEVYLKAYDSVSAAKASLGKYLTFYNTRRPHQSLDGQTPDAIYFAGLPQGRLAA